MDCGLIKKVYKVNKPELAIRTSMSKYREQDWMINVPLYLVSEIQSFFTQKLDISTQKNVIQKMCARLTLKMKM